MPPRAKKKADEPTGVAKERDMVYRVRCEPCGEHCWWWARTPKIADETADNHQARLGHRPTWKKER